MSDLPTCPRCGAGAVDVATLGDRHPRPLAACTCVDELERSAEWLSAGEVDVEHLLAEHRAAVEVLRSYRRRTLELVAERDRLQAELDDERRARLEHLAARRDAIAVAARLEVQLDEALDTIRAAGTAHGHDVARLLEFEDAHAEVQRRVLELDVDVSCEWLCAGRCAGPCGA